MAVNASRPIIITGGEGMLARDLLSVLRRLGRTVVALPRSQMDLTDPAAIRAQMRAHRPTWVINGAAYTAVDRAESEADRAYAVNCDGAAAVANACSQLGSALVQLSTDYVFDGQASRPYAEDQPTAPINVYGASKLAGEQAVRETLPRHLIFRTSWLYGLGGANFVSTMRRLALTRDELLVVNDQHGIPTWTQDLAEGIAAAITRVDANDAQADWGTYHLCAAGATTWHAFAKAIVEGLADHEGIRGTRVTAQSSADRPTPAKRPGYSVLDCRKFANRFAHALRPWRDALREMLALGYSTGVFRRGQAEPCDH